MAVDTVWTNPATALGSGGLDVATNDTLPETYFEKLASNLNRVGGTDGNTKTGNYGIGAAPPSGQTTSALFVNPSMILCEVTGSYGGLHYNAYNDAGTLKAIANAAASRVALANGAIHLGHAIANGVGGALTFINYASLDASGNLSLLSGFIELTERAAPGGSADKARIYAFVDGGGKTDLAAIFQSGVAQIFAQEP